MSIALASSALMIKEMTYTLLPSLFSFELRGRMRTTTLIASDVLVPIGLIQRGLMKSEEKKNRIYYSTYNQKLKKSNRI